MGVPNSYGVFKGTYEDEAVDRQADILTSALQEIPFLDGVWIKDQVISSSGDGTLVQHNLGRAWRGYIITRATAAGAYAYDRPSPDETRFIRIDWSSTPSPEQTFDIWVF